MERRTRLGVSSCTRSPPATHPVQSGSMDGSVAPQRHTLSLSLQAEAKRRLRGGREAHPAAPPPRRRHRPGPWSARCGAGSGGPAPGSRAHPQSGLGPAGRGGAGRKGDTPISMYPHGITTFPSSYQLHSRKQLRTQRQRQRRHQRAPLTRDVCHREARPPPQLHHPQLRRQRREGVSGYLGPRV